MNSDESLSQLLNELDINSRYQLRRTNDRDRRLRQFLSDTMCNTTVSTSSTTTTTTSTPSTSTTTTTSTMSHTHTTPTAWITSKFCGYIPEGVPNREQMLAYDVNRWLCDTETRCLVKGITDDRLKIREAKLSVNTEYGDACRVLNIGRLNEISDYSLFKSKCLKFWRPASEKDRFLALSHFLTVSYDKSLGIFASNLEAARSGIIQDLTEDSSFQKGTAGEWAASSRSDEMLVSLNDVINYISWGVIFKTVPPSFRDALRKSDLSFSQDYIDILSEVQQELIKTDKFRIELSAHATNKQDRTQYRKQEGRNNGANNSGSQNKTFHAKDSGNALKCYTCGRLGHMSKYCKSKLVCTYCKKTGHVVNKCYALQRKNKSGNASSSSNSNSNDNNNGNSQ